MVLFFFFPEMNQNLNAPTQNKFVVFFFGFNFIEISIYKDAVLIAMFKCFFFLFSLFFHIYSNFVSDDRY